MDFTLLPDPDPMQLVMYIGNDFIAAVSINRQQISQPGYVSKMKRRLEEEYSDLLCGSTREPEFLIVQLPAVEMVKNPG